MTTPARPRLPLPLVALLLGLVAGVGLAACGAKSARSSSPMAVDGVGGLDARGDGSGHDPEIQRLDAEIGADLEAEGIEAPTDDEIQTMMDLGGGPELPMAADVATTCEAPPASSCGQVCTMASRVCGNARKICDLADKLDGDDWAAGRCVAGEASCERATARCCDC